MDWLHWAEIIGGGIAAPFTGGATLPIVAAGISGLGQNQAANQLTQASQAVQGQQTGLYNQTRADLGQLYARQQAALTPFTSLGNGAASLLGQGLGVPVTLPPVTTPGGTTPGLGAQGPMPTMQSPGPLSPPPIPGRSIPFPGQPTAADQYAARGRGGALTSALAPVAQRQSSYTQASGTATTRMQAPDGTTEDVPTSLVAHYQSLGAKVI